MLQVGAKTKEAAFSFASGARSLSPMVWRRSESKVAPIAVDDYYNIYSASARGTAQGEGSCRYMTCGWWVEGFG